MKKKILMAVLFVAALTAVILGATLGYKYLSKIYAPETNDAPTTLKTAADFTVLDSLTVPPVTRKPRHRGLWQELTLPLQKREASL